MNPVNAEAANLPVTDHARDAEWLTAHSAMAAGAAPGVEIGWMFQGDQVGVTRWHCRGAGTASPGAKYQFWHVVTFVRGGSYRIRSSAGDGVADSTRLNFFNPMASYETSHPCGCGDHGGGLVLREDLARALVAEHSPRCAEGAAAELFPRALAICEPGLRVGLSDLLRGLGGRPPGPLERLRIEEDVLGLTARAISGLWRPEESRRNPRSSSRRSAAADRERIKAVQELLWLRLDQSVRLVDVAADIGLSVFQLCRRFRASTGMPVHRYLTRLRLDRALQLIEDGCGSDLSRLAFELGFTSHSHFTAAFRLEFGLTPSQLRDRLPRASGLPRARLR